nr:hypothetical protein Hi04_10k_c2441B_00022 [uncultured bacterium]
MPLTPVFVLVLALVPVPDKTSSSSSSCTCTYLEPRARPRTPCSNPAPPTRRIPPATHAARRSAAAADPTTLNGVIALCVHIARKQAITKLRKRKRRQAKGDEGVIDPAEVEVVVDDRQWDRLDSKHELEEVTRNVPEDVQAMFVDRAEGLSDQEIADKHGVSVPTVRATFNKWRVTLRRTAYGAGGAAVLAIVAWLFVHGDLDPDRGRVTHPAPDFTEEAPPPPLPSGTPAQQGATLRDQARAACAANKWTECLAAYDLALRLDPQGETPEVERAHEEAREAVRKHGSGQ